MNLINRMMSYDKNKNIEKDVCDCEECTNSKTENQTVEYPSLSEEEIEKIIEERYSDKDEKTKTFIRKALRKHGDRYDYSNVVYIKASEKVEIICRVKGHDLFLQRPSNHLQGRGCKKCKSEKLANLYKLTTMKFIENSNKIHDEGTYDYSKVNYINMNKNVIIICPIHGEFTQTPIAHLKGCGCPKCGIEKRADKLKLTLEEFIENSNKIHGKGTYNYSKVEYINNLTDIIIICSKHGEFTQNPKNHMSGAGCPKCAKQQFGAYHKLTTEKFIEKSNEVHGEGTYDYSKVDYVSSHKEVIIICPKHGEFLQTPREHLRGKGCSICGFDKSAEKQKLTLQEFIEKANKVHGIGKYDYSKVNYVNNKTEVIIICPIHGEFSQKPDVHLRGCGCPKCNSSKGEIVIRNFLIKNKIEFDEQKRFDDCRYKNPLPFDFYVPKYNLCIEYDGEQHFKPINFSYKMTEKQKIEKFKLIQIRDSIKTEYCKFHNINLLRVNNLKNVEEELVKYFT